MPDAARRPADGLMAALAAVVLVAGAVGVWAYNRNPDDDDAGDAGDAAASESAASDEDDDDGKSWTVMQYHIADTDLEPFMMQDLEEMAKVGSNENLSMVALVDRSAGHDDRGVLGLRNWESAKLLEIHAGGAEEIADLGEVNMGDPTVLARFVSTAIERYPAENYALIMSDHGASWPGVGGDESADHDSLTLAELQRSLQTGLDAADVGKLDVLGFDACLMSTYEVASNVAPVAERMVASQELAPGHGWDYRTLDVLADRPSADAEDLGQAVVDGFSGQAEDEGTRDAITLSVLDLTKMPALDAAVAEFSTVLQGNVGDIAPVVGQKRARALSFGRIPDPTYDTHMTDLGALATSISADAPAVSAQAAALNQAIDDVVLDSVDGITTEGASGISIYFPPQPEHFDPAYSGVANTGSWRQFLQSYYGTGAAIPANRQPRFVDRDGVADVSFEEGGVRLSGAFDPATERGLTEAVIAYGIDAGDQVIFIGEEPATASDDGSGTVTGVYDLTMLTVSDGVTTMPGYLDMEVDEAAGIQTFDVPVAYYAGGGAESGPEVGAASSPDPEGGAASSPDPEGVGAPVILHVTADLATDEVQETTAYLVSEQGMIGELTPAAGSVFRTLALVQAADGTLSWDSSDDAPPLAADADWRIDFEPLRTNTPLVAQLVLTDYGGNEAALSANFAVP